MKYIGYIEELIIIRKRLKEIIKDKSILLNMNMRNVRFNIGFYPYKNKKVGWIHATILSDCYNKLKISIQNFLYKQYNIIFNVSYQGKKDFDLLFPNLKNKNKLLYNSFNIKEILEKSEMNFSIDNNYLFSVGRLLNSQKGFNYLIEAIKLLKDEGFNEKLYLVGDGPDKQNLLNQIKELRLEDNIKLVGFDNNPYKWMKNSKLFILSSNCEEFGLVIVESLICKAPIVSTSCSGPKEILKESEYGILVPTQDPVALKDAIKKMLLDRELRESFKNKSLERAYDFSNEKILRILEDKLLSL